MVYSSSARRIKLRHRHVWPKVVDSMNTTGCRRMQPLCLALVITDLLLSSRTDSSSRPASRSGNHISLMNSVTKLWAMVREYYSLIYLRNLRGKLSTSLKIRCHPKHLKHFYTNGSPERKSEMAQRFPPQRL